MPNLNKVLQLCPLDDKLQEAKTRLDEQLKDNLVTRKQFTVVCGPCSADEAEPMREYFQKLAAVRPNYPNLLLVARVYTTKPHSNGQGYKGTCFHKSILDEVDLENGIIRARQIMIDCLRLGLPVADELLYPELYPYFADLVSYWFVGARSSEDTLHRSFASGLDVCCGVKNGTDGDVLKAVDSVNAVSRPCVFPFDGKQIATDGCKYAHIVLRGGKQGDKFFANVFPEHTFQAKQALRSLGLSDFVMADLSHANSCKVARNQIVMALNVARSNNINGAMIESYLNGGTADNKYGVSKTDDCLSFDDTIKVLNTLEQGFSNRSI